MLPFVVFAVIQLPIMFMSPLVEVTVFVVPYTLIPDVVISLINNEVHYYLILLYFLPLISILPFISYSYDNFVLKHPMII